MYPCYIAGVAEAKGLRAGDRLLEINGISVREASHQEAGRLIAGDGNLVLVHNALLINKLRLVHKSL